MYCHFPAVARREGLAEGREEERLAIADAMRKQGYTEEQIKLIFEE